MWLVRVVVSVVALGILRERLRVIVEEWKTDSVAESIPTVALMVLGLLGMALMFVGVSLMMRGWGKVDGAKLKEPDSTKK